MGRKLDSYVAQVCFPLQLHVFDYYLIYTSAEQYCYFSNFAMKTYIVVLKRSASMSTQNICFL